MSNGKIIETGTHRTYQCSAGPIQKASLHRPDCSCSDAAVWSLGAAGLSIFGGSREGERGFAGSGTEGGLHGQTSLKFSSSSQGDGEFNRGVSECHGHTGIGGLSRQRKAWLSGIVEGKFRCCTTLIGWPLENCLKSISFWFQRGPGFLIKIQPV